MRDRHAVAGPETAEIVPLHAAGIALADAGAGHVDMLAGDEMRRGDLGADLNERILGDAELGELRLRLDLGFRKMAALRFCHILDLGGPDAELQRGVAVTLLGAVGDHLAVVDAQHRDGDVVALVGEDTAHAELLRDQTGAHHASPSPRPSPRKRGEGEPARAPVKGDRRVLTRSPLRPLSA